MIISMLILFGSIFSLTLTVARLEKRVKTLERTLVDHGIYP